MNNVFKYTKQLEDAGFSRTQAELQLQIIGEIVEGDLATKEDLKSTERILRADLDSTFNSIRSELKNWIHDVRTELKIEISEFRHEVQISMASVDGRFQQFEYRMLTKLGGLMVFCFTAMATLLRFWLAH